MSEKAHPRSSWRIENYEHHQRLDNLSASAGELAQAALIDFSRPRPMQKVEALTTINALGHAAGSLS